MKQLKTKSLVQALIDEILEQIKNGKLKPGDSLPSQRQFVEQFNVGRSSVREALQALTLAKIIEVRPGKGAIVSNLSFDSLINPAGALFDVQKKELLDLLESRIILELGAVEIAAKRCTEEDIKSLDEKIELMNKNLKEKRFEEFVSADYDFHRILFDCTYNNILKNIFNSVFRLLINSISLTIKVPFAGNKAVSGHKKILDSLKSHNIENAINAMKEHLQDAKNDFEKITG